MLFGKMSGHPSTLMDLSVFEQCLTLNRRHSDPDPNAVKGNGKNPRSPTTAVILSVAKNPRIFSKDDVFD